MFANPIKMFDAEWMVSNHKANSLRKARTILLLGPRLILLALAITMIFIVVISINLKIQKNYSGKTLKEWVDYPGLEGGIKS